MVRRQVKRRKQKLSNREKNLQPRALPAASPSPSSTMTPVPLSSGGTTMIQAEDYSSSQSSLPLTTTDCKKCRHIASGVNLDKLRRQLLSTRPVQECYGCTHPKGASNPKGKNRRKAGSAAAGAKKVMWICLACGQIGCDQHVGCRVGDFSNATQHYVVMKWGEDLDCLCLKCNAQLQYPTVVLDQSSNGAIQPDLLQKAATLLQAILFRKAISLKEVSHVEADQVPVVPEVPEISEVPKAPEEPEEPEVEEDFKPLSKPAVSPLTSRRVVKGLTNLGNTCFFNSVMQNLVGVSLLREHFSEEASGPEGVLKLSLRKFFQEMDPNPRERAEDSGSSFGYFDGGIRTRSFGGSMGNAVSPRGLFSAICTKAPRFKGYQQQDSHELLRCLLDGLHMEEESIRKAQADPNAKVDDKGKKLPDTLVEHMFGGQFSSTVSCCECGHSSVVNEPFLDLSLPIPSKQSFGKVEPISIQLPKPLAQRSQSGDLSSGNGVLSVSKAAGFSSLNSGVADHKTSPKKPAIVPVLGFNLERSVFGAGAGNGDTSTEHGSASGTTTCDNKDHIGQEVVASSVTPFPCEAPSSSEFVASSSGTEKIDSWLEFLGAPMKGDFEEVGSLLMGSDAGAIGAGNNQPGDGEAHHQEEEQEEEEEKEELDDIPLDNGDQMESEALVYGPQLPSATSFGPENLNECLAMVLSMPSNSSSEVKGDEIPAAAGVQSSTSPSNSKSGPIAASVKLLSRGSEGDGGFEGLGGLFDDDESSGGSARNSRDAETYPIMSLEGCLQAFTKTEKLSGENAWACDNCSRVAHRQREAELREAELREAELQEADCLKQLPEIEWQGRDSRMQAEWESVGLEDCVAGVEDLSTSTNSTRNKSVEERSDRHENGTIIGCLSLLDDKKNSVQRVDGRAGGNLAELNTDVQYSSLGSKSHNRASSNTLNGLQKLDCFDEAEGSRPDKGEEGSRPLSSHEGKEDAGEHYAMVEVNADDFDDDTASCTGRRQPNDASNAVSSDFNTSRSLDMVMKDRKGKASAKPNLLAGVSMAKEPVAGSKKKAVEKEALKMVTLKRDALKRFLISKAPLVLTVHLKRFAQDLHGRLNKLSGHITFHEQLDLGPFIDQRDGTKQGYVYQLIGTVEHSGTMRGGHYVAYVKGPKTETEHSSEGGASTWYYISDSHVRKTTLESVLQSEAYLLFYERQTFE